MTNNQTLRRSSRATQLGLLVSAAFLYIWGLSKSGYANSFYSAAAQAGSVSWKAWFFGSLDAGNAITVDKPPASLWLMGLSVRIFGLSSWSILIPEALLGVASVVLIYRTLVRTLTSGYQGHRRPLSAQTIVAAAFGAVAFAVTPVAVLMFRFNNPDALLTFLCIAATAATLRALEAAKARWLALAGVLVGFAFITKMLQAFLILPALIITYLIAAPTSFWKRVGHLLAACAAMVLGGGWWVAIVELWPASSRPYIGGSQNNSVLELAFGYNGLGRLNGNEVGSVTGGAGSAGFGGAKVASGNAAAYGLGGAGTPGAGAPGGGSGHWGQTGIFRMFSGVSGGMVSWLIPAALILAITALVLLWRRPRTDVTRAAVIAWTGWLLTVLVTFSFMAGIYHDYYTIMLTPAIGALVGLGSRVAWRQRSRWLARVGLSLAGVATSVWACVLLSKASGIYQALRFPVLIVGTLAALALLASHRMNLALRTTVAGIVVALGLTGPIAYSLNTIATPHTGSIVTAGPVSGGMGGPGGRPGGKGGPGGGMAGQQPGNADGRGPGGGQNGQRPGSANGSPSGMGQPPNGTGSSNQPDGSARGGMPGDGAGPGGLLGGATVSTEMKNLLLTNATNYRWAAATIGSQNSASYQLSTGLSVMAIGGFNGSDPAPTLDQFKAYVASGQIRYFIAGGGMGGQQNGGSSAASDITTWVQANFTATTVGSTTVYDLSTGK